MRHAITYRESSIPRFTFLVARVSSVQNSLPIHDWLLKWRILISSPNGKTKSWLLITPCRLASIYRRTNLPRLILCAASIGLWQTHISIPAPLNLKSQRARLWTMPCLRSKHCRNYGSARLPSVLMILGRVIRLWVSAFLPGGYPEDRSSLYQSHGYSFRQFRAGACHY